MPTVAVNDIEVYYEIHGRGDPLMLITGLGGVGASWGKQIRLFAEAFRTIVPDHRGAGRTSVTEGGYTIERHASDMAETLRALETGPAHIVGTSTGGAIAQVMALDHSDVVRSIVLASTWAKTDAYYKRCLETRKTLVENLGFRAYTEASSLFWWSARYIREHYGEVVRWEATRLANPADEEVTAKRVEMLIHHDQLDRLGRVRKPVLVIVGKEDMCTPPYFSEELARVIPGAKLEILDGGHFLSLESPDLFHARVRDFLVRH